MHASLQQLAAATDGESLVDPVSPISGGYVLEVLAGLLLIILLIVLFAWLARRFPSLGGGGAKGLRIVAVLPLGTREKAVLVQVGEQQLLLGVTSASITLLHPLQAPVAVHEAVPVPVFARMLTRFRKQGQS